MLIHESFDINTANDGASAKASPFHALIVQRAFNAQNIQLNIYLFDIYIYIYIYYSSPQYILNFMICGIVAAITYTQYV